MSEIFMKILNMSIASSWVILVVLILRLFLKNIPKWSKCVLWGIAGLRLIISKSVVSVLSFLPSAETISVPKYRLRPYFESGMNILDGRVNTYLEWNYLEGTKVPVGTFKEFMTKLSIIWIIGIIVLLAYMIFSYVRLKRQSPWWKVLAYFLCVFHWFNPFVWIWYFLLCRDMEHVCVEEKHTGYRLFIDIALCVLVAVCFLTDPPQSPRELISIEELQVIAAEVRNALWKDEEKYKVVSSGIDTRDKQISINFLELKPLQFQHDIKKICLESEKVKPILEKYNIRNRDILELFVLDKGMYMK